MNRIPVKCPTADSKYDGTRVRFHIEHDREIVSMTGVFQALPDPSTGGWFLNLECKQPPVFDRDTIDAGFVLHLSQSHVDSISALSDLASKEAWEVRTPFLYRHYISNRTSHPGEK